MLPDMKRVRQQERKRLQASLDSEKSKQEPADLTYNNLKVTAAASAGLWFRSVPAQASGQSETLLSAFRTE